MPDLDDTNHDSLGRRIADLRSKLGWTQQELAERVGISRVAISHLEAGMTHPGERTVTLLAGVFKIEPHELVAGTRYPGGKAERLPVVAARYTEVEHKLALLELDLSWLERTDDAHAAAVLDQWDVRLRALHESAHDLRERTAVAEALQNVRALSTERADASRRGDR